MFYCKETYSKCQYTEKEDLLIQRGLFKIVRVISPLVLFIAYSIKRLFDNVVNFNNDKVTSLINLPYLLLKLLIGDADISTTITSLHPTPSHQINLDSISIKIRSNFY